MTKQPIGSVLVVLLLLVGPATGQTCFLGEAIEPGACYQVDIKMQLTGEHRISREGQIASLPLRADATHRFSERVLLVSKTGSLQKAARYYETARATISLAGESFERTLRPDRKLLIAQRSQEELIVYSPVGPLTRDELELTGGHFDTLSLNGLLPGKEVAVGDSWNLAPSVVQALCGFEGLTEQDLTGKLEAVHEDTARLQISGTANGIDGGAVVKLSIQATARFNVRSKRLEEVVWRQQDEREQGPVSPASRLEVTTTITRTLLEQPDSLSDVALVAVPEGLEVPPMMTQLVHRDGKDRYELHYSRAWHLVGQTDEHLVLRLMERGEFVAQATVTPWTRASPGKHLSGQEFKQAMMNLPGWEPEEEIQAGEIPRDDDCWCYRLSMTGKLDGMRVTQHFYLLAAPNGEQVVVTFTLTPGQVQKLGTHDLSLVGSLALPIRK